MSLIVDIEKQLGSFHLRAKFECAEGIAGLLGASGCGKSYTLKCIAGIERPDRGRIVLDDRILFDAQKGIDLKPQQRRVGYLFQNYALFPNMTVRQNILCGLYAEKDKARRVSELERMIELFQLQGLENHKPAQLSGGQQQRVALARILVNRPQLLMLDEPFSALDTHLRLRLQIEMLSALKRFERPVLMVTHSRDEAYRMCDRIAVMSQGALLAPEETKQLFARPHTVTAATLTGCKNIASARKVSDNQLFSPEWGVTLQTALPIPDDVTHVGIRAHYFGPKVPQNCLPVKYVGEMEEPFEWVLEFRYADQQSDSATIWWRIPKEKRPRLFPDQLGIAPVNVLPLVNMEAV